MPRNGPALHLSRPVADHGHLTQAASPSRVADPVRSAAASGPQTGEPLPSQGSVAGVDRLVDALVDQVPGRDLRCRPLDVSPHTFVAADALVLKVREGDRVVKRARIGGHRSRIVTTVQVLNTVHSTASMGLSIEGQADGRAARVSTALVHRCS